jgi:hypothetical protein
MMKAEAVSPDIASAIIFGAVRRALGGSGASPMVPADG